MLLATRRNVIRSKRGRRERGGWGGRAREEGWGKEGGGRGRNTCGVERSYINWSVRPTVPGPFWECDPGTEPIGSVGDL